MGITGQRFVCAFLLVLGSLASAECDCCCHHETAASCTLTLETIWLERSNGEKRPLAIAEVAAPGAGRTILDAVDLDQEYELGGRFVAEFHLQQGWELEFSGYSVAESKSERQAASNAALDTPFAAGPAIGDNLFLPAGFQGAFDFQNVDLIVASLDSRMYTLEADLLRRWRTHDRSFSGALGGGVRYLDLDENLRYTVDDTVAIAPGDDRFVLDNDLHNRMLGAQAVATLSCRVSSSFFLTAEARLGLMLDWTRRDSSLVRDDGRVGIAADGDAFGFAMLVELSAGARWRVTPRVWMVAGYRVLDVEGASLATENLQGNLSSRDEYRDVRDGGDVYWHGPFVGLEIRF